jgi:hypothetical protein
MLKATVLCLALAIAGLAVAASAAPPAAACQGGCD